MLRILTTLYNAKEYLRKCIGSIKNQSVETFRCYILDDLSTDGSADLAEKLTSSDPRFNVIRNKRKRWQPGNYQHVIQLPEVKDDDICITVDGDDWLPDKDVLQRVLKAYEDPEVWITWGAFWHLKKGKMHDGLSCAVEDVTKQRQAVWHTSHLRTWKAFLWRAIKDQDLRAPDGEYWQTTGDLAFMYPMLEMATNTHARYLPEYNYVYNHDNPLCDSTASGGRQKHYESLIRAMAPYPPLERKPIRAVMLTPNLSMGGAERWIVSLIKYSDPRRLRWCGVALSGWGGCDPELYHELANHTPVISGPPRARVIAEAPPDRPLPPAVFQPLPEGIKEVDSVPIAIRELAAEADVIITWGGYRFDRTVNRPDIPLVLVSHNSHDKPHALTRKQGISHLVAVSEAACRPLIHPGNPPPTVIHNGAEVSRLHPVVGREFIRDQWQIPQSNYVVGYIGRFSREKNPCAAIEAVRALADNWSAVYYGELPARQQAPDPNLLESVQTFGDPQVRVYKHTQHVGDVYAGIDVLMLASHTEAFSMTMIEAWLCGVPIVATPVGAVPELEAKYGPLTIPVPMNPTPEQLAAACCRAVGPEGLEIAARAREIAQQHWTAPAMASRWMDYLEEVVRTFQREIPDPVPEPAALPPALEGPPQATPVFLDLDL